MSDEELKEKINKIAVEIENLEVSAKQKENYIINRINEEFSSKIIEIEPKIQTQQKIIDELSIKIDGLIAKKKNLMVIVKNLKNEHTALKKSKEKALNTEMKAISKEKKTKTKIIDRNIKMLEKELKTNKKIDIK